MKLAPNEGKVPQLHVVSSCSTVSAKEIEVTFGGSCDHGKSQEAADSEKSSKAMRYEGYEAYCPRAEVINDTSGTHVNRPSTLKFQAFTSRPIGTTLEMEHSGPPSILTPLNFLIRALISGNERDRATYDIQIHSCKGSLPYKAQVIAHPHCRWSASIKFGYKASLSNVRKRRWWQSEKNMKATMKLNLKAIGN